MKIRWLILLALLAATPAWAQNSNTTPHAGVGKCPSGQVVNQLLPNVGPPNGCVSVSGAGAVTSVTGGTGINITGTASAPVVNLTTPVTTANGGTGCASATTFASLPAVPTVGTICTITDASSCSVGSSVTSGGGAITCQVDWLGANWIAGGASSGGGSAVSSVSGTTNQVAVSPTTGAAVVSLAGPHNYTTLTAHAVLLGNGTSAPTQVGAGATGTVFGGNGTSADGSFQQKHDQFPFQAAAVLTASQLLNGGITYTDQAETLPSGCTGSFAKVSVVGNTATASTTLTIYKVSSGVETSIGTIVYGASGGTGTFTCASSTSFAAGDGIEVKGPASPDATLIPSLTLFMSAGGL